jgi:adenylate kinase family enzyme/GNAT superfamily N-acetyltransferase
VKLEDLAGAQKKDFSVAKVLERMREKKSQHTLITGRPGSGKTTYLKQLEEQTGLPSIHLDSIPERKAAWEEMMASKKRLEEIENRIVHEALAQKQPHLIEGWQLLNADPKELEPHNSILVEPGYARSMKQFVNRELQRNPKYKLDDLQHRANMLATESKESIKKFRAIPGTKVVQPREKRAAQELYHGSPEKLETLEPKNYHEDPGIPKAVFASPSREFAMAYAGKKWGDRDINQSTRFRDKQRIVTLQENRPGAFDELYKGQPGYLYHVPAEPFEVPHKRTTWEQISRNAVTPTDIETIPDVLAELQRSKGVELLPYEEAAARKAILRRVVRMRQMSPADRQEYVKWWGKKAPPELQPALQEALSKAATVQLPQSLLDEVSKDKWATRAYGQKTLREIKEGKRDVVPIEDKGNIVGFMAPNETKFGYPSTGFVFVSPSSRGKGLAAKVLAEYAKKNPSAISFLHRDNIASQKAHLKAGWEDTGAAARGNPRARVWRVKQAMEKLAAARRKEFAPGIPMNRKIHKIPKVKNPQPWTLAIQKHDANKAGTHFDLRLIPPKGNKAHSWAIPKAKLPKRGVMQLAIQQPTHTKEYATTFSGKIPKGTYGAGKVTMHTNEPVTVLSAGDNRVKFRRASGEQFTLFRTKEKQWGITKTAAEVIDEWRKKKREAKVTAFIRERMR